MKLRLASCCVLALAISASSLAIGQMSDSKTDAAKKTGDSTARHYLQRG